VTLRPYVIVTGDFVRTGGMDRANFALASYLARAGHEVHLVAYRVADELLKERSVIFHRVWKPANSYTLGAPFLGANGLAYGTTLASRGAIVVTNGGNCPYPGLNWVHYVHAAFRSNVGFANGRLAKVHALHEARLVTERLALRSAEVLAANSERTRRDLISRLNIDEHRIHTVYLGVDADQFHPATPTERAMTLEALGWAPSIPRIAFVGALDDRRKGFDVVYDAWRSLCSAPSWDCELVVIGSGRELPAWRARAVRDGVASRIRFLGFRSDVARVLVGCDALVAPTRYEPYGMGVHEALCCGLPAVVASSAGVAERFPESLRGLLLDDVESANELATVLRALRENTVYWRAKVQPFARELRLRSWDDVARDVVTLGNAAA
jgi:glycosyltransferase involved in cell wall biosynthesis